MRKFATASNATGAVRNDSCNQDDGMKFFMPQELLRINYDRLLKKLHLLRCAQPPHSNDTMGIASLHPSYRLPQWRAVGARRAVPPKG